MPSNGEVEGPRGSGRLEPRVHTVFAHLRRRYRVSRTPPTIVRRRSAGTEDERYHHGADHHLLSQIQKGSPNLIARSHRPGR